MLRKILTHCVSDFKLSHGLLTHSINRQDYRYCSKLTEDQNSAKDRLGEEMDKVPTENSLEYDDKSLKDSSAEKLLRESRLEMDDVQMEFPSDVDDYWSQYKSYNAWNRDQKKHAYRPKMDPSDTSVLLFPGQGSQFVGMGRQLLEYPNVLDMYKVASKILGYDILELCLNGPQEKLDKTQYCQPAILVTSLAAVEKLRYEKPNAIESCITALGFSVGEIAALVFAGSFSFEEAVQLVKVRAEAMQKASERQASGMMTVFLHPSHKVKFACHAAKGYCKERLHIEDPVCEIANYLFPECKVIAGHEEALQFIEKIPEEFGIKRTKRLPVSGAFHTKLMRYAAKPVELQLEKIDIEPPAIAVHSNANSYKYKQPQFVKKYLTEQVYKPVMWEQIMHIVFSRKVGESFPNSYELGPGKQLGTLLRMVNRKAFAQYQSVQV